jgi:methionine-S-sulfoxide reductase
MLEANQPRKANTMTSATERAVLAGGCFWGMQDLIRKLPGVIATRVGYSGGDVPNATYRHHGTHAEAIEITFDPKITNYRTLLEFFFQIHDPTTRNRQKPLRPRNQSDFLNRNRQPDIRPSEI